MSTDAGEAQPEFPVGMHRNAEIEKGMEGRDRSDQPGDAVKASDQPAGTHLLHCRPPAMVAGLRKMLVAASVDEDDIRTEDFAGY